jgi:DNA-directed DNA polymerase III PolC
MIGPHKPLANEMIVLSGRFGFRCVAVHPIYCLDAADRAQFPLMAAIDANCRIEAIDPGSLPDGGDEAQPIAWPEPDALARVYADHPDLLAATGEVARLCSDALPDGRPIWPVLGIDAPAAILRRQADDGLRDRYGATLPSGAADRLQKELDVINGSGFAPFFLLIADVVRYARHHKIPVSTRGSVANSLVAYCLGITTVDPIAHDLLFERFLSPARSSPPDIDLDFCSRRRDEILDYIRRTYGHDRVALISTMNTLQPRSAVRETGKAFGLPENEITALIRVLPKGWHPDPRRRTRETIQEVVDKLDDENHRSIIRQAYRLVGRPHHPGLHPGGVIITPGPLTDTLPVLLSAKGFLASQYEHGDVDAIGLPKLDLLGIRALTVLADAEELVRQHHDPSFYLDSIPLTDERTGDMLAAGETIGVFQCESEGARRTLRELKVRTIADLAVAGAFFKPGPAMGGMAKSFIRRYRGEEAVTYLHPALEPILGRTKGVLLFQEQVLRVATEIAGLSWRQADRIRRGMSKFQAAEIDALAAEFLAGCCRPVPEGPGLSAEQAARLWAQIMPFAGYGFNQGHATAYADVSYRSAYIKAHWPGAFLSARLADAGGFHHPAVYMAEAARLGIIIRPPHINHSRGRYTLAYETGRDGQTKAVLWMGLGHVRDLRHSSIAAIMAARADSPFRDVTDCLARVPLQSKEAANLIRCGALDGLGPDRQTMLAQAGIVTQAGSVSQMTFDFLRTKPPAESLAQQLAWESEILGQPVSVNPLETITTPLKTKRLAELATDPGQRVAVAGFRIPGWTGGQGIFVGDGETFITVRLEKTLADRVGRLAEWQPMLYGGRWRPNEWQGGWFEADAVETIK